MKRKAIAGIMLTLALIVTLFIAFPAKSQFVGTIRIGVIGPMPWAEGRALNRGATAAAAAINGAGGIVVSSGAWNVKIVTANTVRGRWRQQTTASGTAAAMGLVASGVDFVIGGFSTAAAYGIREVVADSALSSDKPIFIITGASTNELIDDGTGSDPATVRSDYNRYRFVFRNRYNSTMRFYSIAGYLKYLMIAKLAPIFAGIPGYCDKPLKISVISETLTWANTLHTYLTNEGFWNHAAYMNMAQELRGVAWNPYNMSTYGVDVVAPARVGPTAGVVTVNAALNAADAAGAQIIIHALSGSVGTTFTTQWDALGIDALPIGINMDATDPAYWTPKFTAPEYETTLAVAGTRTPITPILTAFWDAYVATYGSPPIEAAYRAYDSVMAIRDMILAVGKWPMGAGEMVPHIEKTFRLRGDLPGGTAMLGTFRYTGPHPMSLETYGTYIGGGVRYNVTNPTMMGTLHDVYMTPQELTPYTAYPYYTRPLFVQWQKHPVTGVGRLEVVHPLNEPYSKKFKIPPWMYRAADVDISGPYGYPDGRVDIYDLSIATYCWLSSPGDFAWDYYGYYLGLVVDQDGNSVINMDDIETFGKWWDYDARDPPPDGYGQWPL